MKIIQYMPNGKTFSLSANAREVLISVADEFQNEYLTYEGFASHNAITVAQAATLIELAQSVRRSPHPDE